MSDRSLRVRCCLALSLACCSSLHAAEPMAIPLPMGVEDFNSLASTGTSSAVPRGWGFVKSGSDLLNYAADAGDLSNGNAYSYGSAGSSERAFGSLRASDGYARIGAKFTNNLGVTLTSLRISYTGELWHLGTATPSDSLSFQYSVDQGAMLSDGTSSPTTFVDFKPLNFQAPATVGSAGAVDGNATTNRLSITKTITGLSLANNAKITIRWFDATSTNASGLAIDDFSIVGNPAATPEPGVALLVATASAVLLAGRTRRLGNVSGARLSAR